MSRKRGTGHLRKPPRAVEKDCPDEWIRSLGRHFGPVIEVVWLEPGAECPFCPVGMVHEHRAADEA